MAEEAINREMSNKNVGARPLSDHVIVKRLTAEEGVDDIIAPDSAKEKPQQAEVMSVGSGKLLDSGERAAPNVKAGDRVLFGKYAGAEIKIGGDDYLILSEDEILGVLDEPPKALTKKRGRQLQKGVGVRLGPISAQIDKQWIISAHEAMVKETSKAPEPEIEIVQRAADVLGSERVAAWMQKSIPSLGGRTPYSLLGSEEGRKQVDRVLGRIEHGVY